MKYIMLIFSVSVLILLIGLFIGFPVIEEDYVLPDGVQEIGQPLVEDFDKEFIRESVFLKTSPAYE